jgi:Uma2 family endonuclease
MMIQSSKPKEYDANELAPDAVLANIWKLTVEQYHKMIQTGTLHEDDPVELLEGWLVTKADYVGKKVTFRSIQNDDNEYSTSNLGLDLEDIWKLSVEQYHQMIANGTLNEDDPVELLEGWLIAKMPKDPTHTFSVEESADLIQKVLPQGYYVKEQNPITMTDSEPEPDVSVIKGTRRDFLEQNPTANDIVLVIEVANSSLRQDRTLKQSIYAIAGIPIYWIINLLDKAIEVYTQPVPEEKRYAEKKVYGLEQTLPFILEGKEIAQLEVKNLLP